MSVSQEMINDMLVGLDLIVDGDPGLYAAINLLLPQFPTVAERVVDRLRKTPEHQRVMTTCALAGECTDYDVRTMLSNVIGVVKDVKAGRIRLPTSLRDWEDAIVNEYLANCRAVEH